MKLEQSIGVWGLGVMGKSAIPFLRSLGYRALVYDSRAITDQEQRFLDTHQATLFSGLIEQFLDTCTTVVPSPGIDLRPHNAYAHKWLCELDLFYTHCKTPIIAITGSVGKTTVTHLLSELLKAQGYKVVTGGNIGIGSFDLLKDASLADYVILEVSSFQLEQCKAFAPALALWTNLYPNHLDRHGTMEEYRIAKEKIIAHQTPAQHALLSLALAPHMKHAQAITYFSTQAPTEQERASLKTNDTLIYLDHQTLYLLAHEKTQLLAQFDALPITSYTENFVALAAALHMLGASYDHLNELMNAQEIPEHRLEKVATINCIDFYNDSKATIPASTLAAIEKLQAKPILLFIGGLSKGVDRRFFIETLRTKIKVALCFGKEATHLKALCDEYQIPAYAHDTLDQSFDQCIQIAQPEDQILFSPAGSSYDLFQDYKERGCYFKKLVQQLRQ